MTLFTTNEHIDDIWTRRSQSAICSVVFVYARNQFFLHLLCRRPSSLNRSASSSFPRFGHKDDEIKGRLLIKVLIKVNMLEWILAKPAPQVASKYFGSEFEMSK